MVRIEYFFDGYVEAKRGRGGEGMRGGVVLRDCIVAFAIVSWLESGRSCMRVVFENNKETDVPRV